MDECYLWRERLGVHKFGHFVLKRREKSECRKLKGKRTHSNHNEKYTEEIVQLNEKQGYFALVNLFYR